MNVNQLASSLLRDARKEAKRVDTETHEETVRYDAETDAIVSARRTALHDAARNAEEAERHRLEAQRDRDARIAELAEKRALMTRAHTAAEERLHALPKADRERLLLVLWNRAREEIDAESVRVAAKDAPFFSKRAVITGMIDSAGGFVATGKDERVTLDLTFETLLEEAKMRCENDVAHILFGGGA